MFAVPGCTLKHAVIAASVVAALGPVRAKKCYVVSSDLRIRISPRGPFVYPDFSIFCGEAELADDHKDILLNPTVVFEVLSKSSEAHDRGRKFSEYRKIPSLQEYVLISQTEPRIEVFLRQPGGKWMLTEFVGVEATCHLASVDCNFALASVYDGVNLEPESA
jgi:Uma2 family endonuclease